MTHCQSKIKSCQRIGHVQTAALLAVSAHALYRAGVDRQRDAGRGHDDRRQQRDGGLHASRCRTASTASSPTWCSRATASKAFPTPSGTWTRFAEVAGDDIAGMTPTVARAGDAQLTRCSGQWVTRQVNLIGIDAATHGRRSAISASTCSIRRIASSSAFNLRERRLRRREDRSTGGRRRQPRGRKCESRAGRHRR